MSALYWFFTCFLSFFSLPLLYGEPHPAKVLICGVCKNVGRAAENTILNIEKLGSHFHDYGVIIYENNSQDDTVQKFLAWSETNPKVLFLTENLPSWLLPLTRVENIARARNIVLSAAKRSEYQDFEYLIMVDLDFTTPWPIDEIVATIKSPSDWDCVSSNGMKNNVYYDRFAFRNKNFPFGPELIGDQFWFEWKRSPFKFTPQNPWVATYSAFGALAIYKRAVVTQFAYSGTVTEDLRKFYKIIIPLLPKNNSHLQYYMKLNKIKMSTRPVDIPIIFRKNTPSEHPLNYEPIICCEHVPLHASLFVNGYTKFYMNSKMIFSYE